MHMRRMVHIAMNMRREQVKHVNANITTWTVGQPSYTENTGKMLQQTKRPTSCFYASSSRIFHQRVCVPQDCPHVLVAGCIFQMTFSKSACNPATQCKCIIQHAEGETAETDSLRGVCLGVTTF